MAPNDEPKMDELKRLLRRLDGLDARRAAPGGGTASESEQRDYVGTLRGAPELDDVVTPVPAETRSVSPKSAALLAAVIAGIVSTATVYVLMSAEERMTAPASVPALDRPRQRARHSPGQTDPTATPPWTVVRSASIPYRKR